MKRLILAAALFSIASVAVADEPKKIDAVDARQAYYRILEYNMSVLAPMASSDAAYDTKQVKAFVDNLMAMEQYGTASLFPPNTSKADMPGRTRALPNIWTDFASVAGKGQVFKEALLNLEATSGNGRIALGTALGRVGAACMGCHKSHVAEKF